MNKGVLIYIAILVVMLVAALFLSGALGGKGVIAPTTTTIESTTTVNVTTTIMPLNTTTTSTTTSTSTTVIISPCESKNKTSSIFNGDFGLGTFDGWNSSMTDVGGGLGFGTAPFNLAYANANGGYYNAPWTGYNGSYFASTYHAGLNVQPGNLTSAPFKVDELYLNFKIVSPQDSEIYVEVLQGSTPKVIAYYNTYAAQGVNATLSTFVNASIPLVTLLCQNVSVRIHSGVVGTDTNQYDFVAVGDFYKSNLPVATPGIVVNETIS